MSPTPSLTRLKVILDALVCGGDAWSTADPKAKTTDDLFRLFVREAEKGSTEVRRLWRRTSGATYPLKGRQLVTAEAIDDLVAHNRFGSQTFFLAAVMEKNREAVAWALRCGLNPNRFCAKTQVTPVGAAGYTAQVGLLRMMWAAGADLELRLSEEHVLETTLAAGSTLLHRVLQRATARGEPQQVAKTAVFLASVSSDPMRPDASGLTVLDAPSSEAREAVRRWVSEHAHQRLSQDAPHAGGRLARRRI